MARLNMVKMIGLVVLLAIALTLPTVLPETTKAVEDNAMVQKTVG